MGFGKFYAVDDSARQLLMGCSTESDWHDALGKLDLDECSSCDGEESFWAWELALAELESPVKILFNGELRAQQDGFDDPDVAFIGAQIVQAIAIEMKKNGREYFHRALYKVGCDADAWLFEPILCFLEEAATRGSAIVTLSGR